MTTANQIAAAKARLIELLGTSPVIYGDVKSVAKSGMSRKIAFYCVVDGKIQRVTYEIALILGLKHEDGTLIKKGCGMDMVFSVIYDLSVTLYDEPYKIKNRSL